MRQSRHRFPTCSGPILMQPFELRKSFLTLLLIFSALCTTTMAQRRKATVDLIIRGGTVVTMDSARRIIENGAVAGNGGHIIPDGSAAESDVMESPRDS